MSDVITRNGLITLTRVRTSYLYCFEPYKGKPTAEMPNPKDIYKSDFILAPTHPDLVRLAAKIEEVGSNHQWKAHKGIVLTWAQIKETLRQTDKLPLKKGDVSAPGDPAYAGMYFLKASSKRPFTVLDGDRTPLRASDGRPLSGDWVNAIVDIWPQDNNFGRRINCTVTGIQFVQSDEHFGGGAAPARADEFGIVATSADEATPTGSIDPLAGLGL